MSDLNNMQPWMLLLGVIVLVLVVIPGLVASFLRNVDAGTIRLVSWLNGGTVIYRGPGKSKEIPLFTTGTTLSSKVINVDLDITDQTADLDASLNPRPIKVRVLASAIVSVGDTDMLIKTAANRFFSKSEPDGRTLSRPSRPCGRAVDRREIADPGARSIPAGTPAQVRAMKHDDA